MRMRFQQFMPELCLILSRYLDTPVLETSRLPTFLLHTMNLFNMHSDAIAVITAHLARVGGRETSKNSKISL